MSILLGLVSGHFLALGAGLDLNRVWQASLPGLGMGVAVVGVTGIPLHFADRLAGGNGVDGVAAALPVIVAVANPVYLEAARRATIVIAAWVVATSLLVPVLAPWLARRNKSGPSVATQGGPMPERI
jgi:2-keto-3-deoxygluconate permease